MMHHSWVNFKCEVVGVNKEVPINFRGIKCISVIYDQPYHENIYTVWLLVQQFLTRVLACYSSTLDWFLPQPVKFNTLRPRQNGRLFADDTFKRIFLNENIRISFKISLRFVPNGLINNISSLVLIMAWRRPGDKPLSEPMMVRLPTHICVTLPQLEFLLKSNQFYQFWSMTGGHTQVF